MAQKFFKPKGAALNEIETSVNSQLVGLETSEEFPANLRAELKAIHFLSAREVASASKKTIVIFVPFKHSAALKAQAPHSLQVAAQAA